jgi:hypothetical protein
MRRSRLRIGVVCAFGALAAAASCRAPTEVTLVLSTDVPCAMLTGTSITVGTAADVETSQPVTVTNACEPSTGNIGTFVLIPESGSDEAFAVRIVSAVGGLIANCTPPDYTGCIVARRELAFIPHTPLTLPIEMTAQCLDISCTGSNTVVETCSGGTCKSAMVNCATSGACQSTPEPLPDATTPVDATQPDHEATDGAPEDTTVPDVSPSDSHVDDSESGPDVALMSETSTMDVASIDAPPPFEASFDAPADAKPDATAEQDAAPDATASDASDASAFEGSTPGDGGPLGMCIAAGSSAGVECAGGTCAAGEVCCVDYGSTVTEACTAPAACDVNSTGGDTFSSLGCRNIGDCPSGDVCCVTPSAVSSGLMAACASSCVAGPLKRVACRNVCECTTGTCKAVTCSGVSFATCGGICP